MALQPHETATFKAWYGRTLSSIALMTGGDELLYCDGDLGSGDGVKITVITSNLVVVVDVETTTVFEDLPPAVAVPRGAILNLAVAAEEGVPTDSWKGIQRRAAAPTRHYERVSFLTLFVTAAVPNHTGGTPIWFNILGAIFIVIVMAVVVARQRRK